MNNPGAARDLGLLSLYEYQSSFFRIGTPALLRKLPDYAARSSVPRAYMMSQALPVMSVRLAAVASAPSLVHGISCLEHGRQVLREDLQGFYIKHSTRCVLILLHLSQLVV